MKKNSVLRKAVVLILCLSMVLSFATVSYADIEPNEGSFTSISKTRLSMTEQQEITVTFNLGEGTTEDNLKWYFGDQPFEEWENWIPADEKDPEGPGQQVFTVKSLDIAENGDATATIGVNYLFDGPDAAYWRPWWAYRGNYVLKVVDTATNKSASQEMRYEPYDSYHTYDELDSTITDIIANKTNDIYMSWESTGKDTIGMDIKEVVIAKDEAAVDKWFELKERMENEPEAVLEEIKAGTLTNYQIPVYITNIHANESPSVDAQIKFLEKIANEESISYKTDKAGTTKDYKIKDILKDLILIVRPTENPYAMREIQRANANGFDLNRDSTNQTQIESQVATADLLKWAPATLLELHGFLYYSRASFYLEPCTPPHEPNMEYDLFMNYAVKGAEAFGEVASQNTKYHVTDENVAQLQKDYPEYNPQVGDSWYEVNIRDGKNSEGVWAEPRDDMSSNYTNSYALINGIMGYTVECGELNEESTKMHMYGVIGHTAWAAENKENLFKNQLEFFKRSNNNEESDATEEYFVKQNNEKDPNFREKNENGKFYPEYYVIPLDVESQRDLADAYDMQEYFLRNGVKLEKLTEDVTVGDTTYKAGSLVIPLAQARRSMANVVLYKGAKIIEWSNLDSESVTNFPELRGFDCDAITVKDAFNGKTEPLTSAVKGQSVISGKGTKTLVIANDGLDTVNAVNDLLAKGVQVGFITEAGDGYAKGDFVIEYSKKSKLNKEYVLHLIALDTVPKAKIISEPKVYIMDASPRDLFAFTNQMNFKTADNVNDANVVFGSSVPEEGPRVPAEDIKAKTAILEKGVPFVGASTFVLDFAKKNLNGFDFFAATTLEETAQGYEEVYNGFEALYKVNYEADSLVTASYAADEDDTIYTKSGSYITAVPDGAEVLIKAQSGDDFYKAGWWNGVEKLKGQVVAIDYKTDNLNMTIFANSITNRSHQTDDYRLATNAIYSKLLGDNFAVKTSTYVPSTSAETVQKPTVEADANANATLSADGTKLTISAKDGYEVKDVSVNGVSKGAVTELTGLKTGDQVVIVTSAKPKDDKLTVSEEMKELKLVARSKNVVMKNGKKAILITWYDKNGNDLDFDGVQIYRSTKKNSGYGTKPIFISKTDKYYNTAIKAGTKYYYKVRGYVIIDGKKCYTNYSLKAIRTAA